LNWRPQLDMKTILKLSCDWYKAFYDKKDIIDLTNEQINSFLKLWH